MTTKPLILILTGLLLLSCNQEENSTSEIEIEEYNGKPMNGIPASPESQVTLMNFSKQPYSKWAFRNPGAVYPTLMVPRDGKIYYFPEEIDNSIESIKLDDSGITIQKAFEEDDVDGIIVIKNGVIKFEKYFGDFKPNNLHLWASSTKSLTALCAGILVDKGLLNLDEEIAHYLPEMKGSAFEHLKVQQVLNMVSALDYSEDYADLKPGSVHYEYFRRLGLTPAFDLMELDPKKDDTPRGNLRYITNIQTDPKKNVGEIYEYHSPNVDVIGLIITRLSGQPLDEFVSENVWSKIGAEHDATFGADTDFNAIATGGFQTTLRDFAKFGYTVLNDGKFNGIRIFPSKFIENTFKLKENEIKAGQKSIYRIDPNNDAYNKYFSGYKNFWWVHDPEKQIMMAQGVWGQGVYIDKSKNLIIAMFGSAPTASNSVRKTWKTRIDALVKISEYYK